MALSFKQSLAYFWEQIGKQFLKNGKDVEYEVLLPKTTLEPNDSDDGFIIPDTIGVPVGGQEYAVVYNGETYYCTAQNSTSTGTSHICVIGDASKLNVEGMPAGEKDMPFLIALAIEDSSNTITESIFQAWDNAASVTLEILVNAGPVYLTKNLNDELIWVEREFYDRGDVITEVIKNGYLESDLDGTYLRGDFVGAITAGHTYIVHTDNGDYECKAWKIPEDIIQTVGDTQFQDMYRNFVVLGSSNARMVFFPIMDGVNIDTDIPFTLAFAPGLLGDTTLALVSLDSDFTTNNLIIDEKNTNIKKLDPKYIHTPDWNAGENQPGYIANKTHGYEYSENVSLVSIDLNDITSDEAMLAYLAKPLGLEVGEKYTVILDDTSYEATALTATVEGLTIIYLGDLAALDDPSTASVPFCIAELPIPMNGMYWQPVAEIQTLLEIRGRGKTIKKLNNEFINWPDWMPELTQISDETYIDYTGLSWEKQESTNKYVSSSNHSDEFCAVDWEEGAFYGFEYDGKIIKLYCSYEPGNYDFPTYFILSTATSGSFQDKLLNSQVAILINISHTQVNIFSNTQLGKIHIINKYCYTKQIPISTLQYPIFSLATGNGDNSLLTRNSQNRADGVNSIALGYCSTAAGFSSLAFGMVLNSVENYDSAFSYSVAGNSEAIGDGSVTFGGRSEGRASFSTQTAFAKGDYSVAFNNTRAYGTNQTTLGKYNIADTTSTYAFIVGNGSAFDQRSNALTVNWNGNVWAKNLYVGGTSETVGASKVATEAYVNNLMASPILESITDKESVAGPINRYNTDFELGDWSFTWGYKAGAFGQYSIAMGSNASVYTDANYGIALGNAATVLDGSANSIAIGCEAQVSFNVTNAVAIGAGTLASSNNLIALGKYNKSLTNYSLVVGNGSSASARSNAFGVTTSGTGYFAGDLYVNGTGTSSTFTGAKKVATESYVDTKVAGLVDSAPGTLNTLNELAAALGDDPDFATTVATEIGKKADKTDLVALTEAEILEVCVIN